MIVALIQTRMHSTRLPGKCMMKLLGKEMPTYVIEAAQISKINNFTGIIYPKNDYIFEDKYFNKCFVFGGSEQNVLSRYYNACQHIDKLHVCEIKHVIRLTSDTPLLYFYPNIIDEVINAHLMAGADYTHNRGKFGYPSGLDVEIMKYSTLKKIYNEAEKKEHLEHVTLYVKDNPERFNIKVVNCSFSFNCKWSVDTKEDFEKVEDMIKIIKMERGIE